MSGSAFVWIDGLPQEWVGAVVGLVVIYSVVAFGVGYLVGRFLEVRRQLRGVEG